jgi:arabinogalactan oligomer/maltooligosaccharide transport system permease protein
MMTVVAEGRAAPTPERECEREPRRGLLRRLRHSYDRYWYAWAMCLPVVLVLGVLVGYPLIQGVYLTFTNATSLNVGRTIGVNHIPDSFSWVGFKNYVDVLSGPDNQFWPHFAWTVVWTVLCVVLTYGIGLGLAVVLNRNLRGRTVYRLLLILPWAVPTFVTLFAWRLILADDGALNQFLGFLHLGQPSWLSDPLAQRTAAIGVNIWCGVPFMMVAILGGLQSIPNELYEAAEMDGATPLQRFLNVTIPGLRPVTSTVILLSTVWTFNMFPIIYLLLGNNTTGDTDILVTYAYQKAFTGISDYSGAATYGIVILLILVAFSTFYRRQIKTAQD